MDIPGNISLGTRSQGGGGGRPRYTEPKFDWREIQGLTQEQMAPGYSELRRSLRNIRGQTFANPMEAAETYRGAVEGMGEALGGIQAGASRAAYGLYQPQYESKRRQALADYEREMDEYERRNRERETIPGSPITPRPTETRRLPDRYIETGYRPLSMPSGGGNWWD